MTIAIDGDVDTTTPLQALLTTLQSHGLRAVRDDGADMLDAPDAWTTTEEVTLGILLGVDPKFVDHKPGRFRRTRTVRVSRDWIGSITWKPRDREILDGEMESLSTGSFSGIAYGPSSAAAQPVLPKDPDDDEYATYQMQLDMFRRRVLMSDKDSLVLIAGVIKDLRRALPDMKSTMYHRAERRTRSERLIEEGDNE